MADTRDEYVLALEGEVEHFRAMAARLKADRRRVEATESAMAAALAAALEELRQHVPNTSPARIQARKALDVYEVWHREPLVLDQAGSDAAYEGFENSMSAEEWAAIRIAHGADPRTS